jgi:hypothetical protein
MKIIIYLFAFSILFTSCASHKKIVQGSASTATVTADGSSFEKAIYITESHETPGIHAEYAWIREKYPNYKLKGQSLSTYKNKPYDIIHITTADGKDMDIYFDISNFYGKF